MKNLIKSLTLCAVVGAGINLNAQIDPLVTVDPGTLTLGFMNVFSVGGPGYGIAGAGGFVFNSSWGTPDLVSSFSGPTLTLSPNVIGDPNPFWYTPAGGPGSVGNKIMDASLYNETTGVYTGQILSFSGNVLSSSLLNAGNVNAIGNGWTSVAFIKDFAPDYSSSVSITAPLVNGVFNISLATINDPARHVQYGFETIGPDVWVTDVGPFGNVVIAPVVVPEPTSLALIGLGMLGVFGFRRNRSA